MIQIIHSINSTCQKIYFWLKWFVIWIHMYSSIIPIDCYVIFIPPNTWSHLRFLARFLNIWINVREYRRGNQKWTIQRNWQHCVHNTQDEYKKKQKNTTRKQKNKNKQTKKPRTFYVLGTIRKQAHLTYIRHEPSYKQLEVKTNRTSFLCGNRNGHHNTEIRT